jgi:phospholipid/cholesterol/gamma-HCH transport system permease protein
MDFPGFPRMIAAHESGLRHGEAYLTAQPSITTSTLADRVKVVAGGTWTIAFARELETLVAGLPMQSGEIDLAAVERLDTFGAWLLEDLMRQRGGKLQLAAVPDRFRGLLDEVSYANRELPPPRARRSGPIAFVELVGENTFKFVSELWEFIAMLGAVMAAAGNAIIRPRLSRFTSIVHHLDRVGLQSVGIIVLMTFLVGGILSQQGIYHFRRFGAGDYVVNMLGILVLREIGVLLVTIMVAGRSGSAYTAELGSMKMREEVDALRTMSVDPADVLVLPRVVALVIAMPILTFLGSMAALVGGGLVAWFYGGMSPEIFVVKLREAVSIHDFLIGMIKAPVMALVIGIIACMEGMRVQGSAESLGMKTTTSVVKSIFMVIVLDGLFAMFFASIGW